MIGEKIGQYIIEERLGGGGMGVVYRARDTDLDRVVAMKFLPSPLAADEEAKKRFIAEARAASALDHPNICTIYQIGEHDDGQLFIAMACYEGRTLKAAIAEDQISTDTVIDYAAQIAAGLGRAHEAGIVHRDVKPANIMITKRGRVKILDFGLAKARERSLLTREGSLVGTVSYMSPEQVRSEETDQRSDVWSLGVVLYEMLAGRRPFDGDYEHAIMYSILNTEPVPLGDIRSDIPSDLAAVVAKCLEKDPDDRFDTAEELVDRLKAITLSGPSATVERRREGRLPAFPKPLLFGAVGVLLLAIVANFVLRPSGGPAYASVAVLPLRTLSEDTQHRYFADGVTEALITRLSKISALERVISPQSVARYADTDMSVSEIASELGVDAIVRGTIQPSGSTVSIRVELTDGGTDRLIWSEGYRREMRNVLELQDELARAIVREVQLSLTPEEEAALTASRDVDPEAFNLYVRGRHFWRQHRFPEADSLFRLALEHDPEFALAYSGLAENLLVWGHFGKYPADAFPQAIDYAERALAYDPTLAEAHTALADSRFHWNWSWDAVERGFDRALSLNPNYETAYWWSAGYLASMKRLDEAIARLARAQNLNPVDPGVHAFMARILHFAGRYEEAVASAQRSLEIYPTAFASGELAKSYVELGRYQEAIRRYENGFPHPNALAGAAYAHAKAGDSLKAREILAGLDETSRRQRAARRTPEDERTKAQRQILASPQVYPYYVSFAYAALGDIDAAFEKLEEAARIRDASLIWVNVEPALEPLRGDPRYADLLERMNLPA